MRTTPIILSCVALLAGCSSPPTPAPAIAADSRGGVLPGYPLDIDVVAPLVFTTLGPDPIPVQGTDGKFHVAYEVAVLNAGPRPVSITQVETLANGPDGATVARIDQKETVARTLLIPNYSPAPITEIPVGRTAVLVLDDTYADRAEVPAEVTHRLTATLGPAGSDTAKEGARYPDAITQIGGAVRTSTQSPVVIGPPLAGDNWAALNGCCSITSHRGAVMAVAGRLNGSERYAIDWVRFDPHSHPLSTFTGAGTNNADYRAYDAPLLAVADGTVSAVVSDMKEAVPHIVPTDLTFPQLGGNYLIIDIGDGNFAFYAHMIPGSAAVKVGDKVTRGQVIGRLGNSGNTSEAHLHFHVSRAPLPLSSDNVPYLIDKFAVVGSIVGQDVEAEPKPSERTNQLPLDGSVVNFPPAQ
ncbi:M23 family metallopeptidase [Mycolicibacterium komossense]|uniref:M23 family metallopeptidase n=1 Tax=Mycolicibacterium komossense TaxID=1779 RepID=A0ABT3CCI6_9MYCO|nr:M23 family metallopeptidase [Mycolicibacterium komossense]MCV7227214.1 M23 family metallopeptidase [Mycolicibacterium komossense]